MKCVILHTNPPTLPWLNVFGGEVANEPTQNFFSTNLCSPEKKKQEDIYRHTEEKNFLQKLAHMILEAENSHNLPSTSQRTRRVGGIIQSESEGLSTSNITDGG